MCLVEAEQATAQIAICPAHLSRRAVHKPLEDCERLVDQADRDALAHGGQRTERLQVHLRAERTLRKARGRGQHRAECRLKLRVRYDVCLAATTASAAARSQGTGLSNAQAMSNHRPGSAASAACSLAFLASPAAMYWPTAAPVWVTAVSVSA
jgi:hypothetical protein